MKNIQILVLINEKVQKADFMMEDIATRMELEQVELDELISNDDDDIYELFEQIDEINVGLNMLSEDMRGSICNEGFDCEDYARWCNEIEYDPMRMTGLIETFEKAHKVLEFYISETLRGYRILTQDGYDVKE